MVERYDVHQLQNIFLRPSASHRITGKTSQAKHHRRTQPSAHPIIHTMLRHRTPFPDDRPQQRRAIDLGPYTPVVAAFVVGIGVVEGGEEGREVGVCVFVLEEAGEVEDVGAGEGYEDRFVWGEKRDVSEMEWWGFGEQLR